MNEYHKIQSAWLRDPEDKFKTFLEGVWALPEFDFLANNTWRATEKIDGTNIRVVYDFAYNTVTFKGKSDAAQIPAFLLAKLEEKFPLGELAALFPTSRVCLYGEGYGARIQKGGGNYIPDGVDFILFDVWIDGLWLTDDNVRGIGAKLNTRVVPIIRYGTLNEIIEETRTGFLSWIAPGVKAEGVVARPLMELQTRRGHRIITKVKHADFAKVEKNAE